jgi:hypothetical protein
VTTLSSLHILLLSGDFLTDIFPNLGIVISSPFDKEDLRVEKKILIRVIDLRIGMFSVLANLLARILLVIVLSNLDV